MVELDDKSLELAHVAGVTNLEEWKRAAARCSEIPSLLKGNVESAWERCLPEWMAFGRVRGRSLCLKLPKFWAPFAACLGSAFVQEFSSGYEFLISQLSRYSVESNEYLCVCDLLESMLHDQAYESPAIVERLTALPNPLHRVIQYECENTPEYRGYSDSLGTFLQRMYTYQYVDDE